MDKIHYSTVGYVIASMYRYQILSFLNDSVKMPKEISKELNTHFSQISTSLTELKKKKLVICLNESRSKGRFYKATEHGKGVLKTIDELRINTSNLQRK